MAKVFLIEGEEHRNLCLYAYNSRHGTKVSFVRVGAGVILSNVPEGMKESADAEIAAMWEEVRPKAIRGDDGLQLIKAI